jgi:hypothetical protein
MARKGERESDSGAEPKQPESEGNVTDETRWHHARVRAGEVVEGVSHELMNSIDLKQRVERNPYGVLATGVGIGFVLGGGLFTRFTGRIFATVARMALLAAMPVVQKQLWAAALDQLDNAENVNHHDEGNGLDEDDTASPNAT